MEKKVDAKRQPERECEIGKYIKRILIIIPLLLILLLLIFNIFNYNAGDE